MQEIRWTANRRKKRLCKLGKLSPIFLRTMNMIHGLSYLVNIFTMIKLVKEKYDISNIRTTTASIDPKAEKGAFSKLLSEV